MATLFFVESENLPKQSKNRSARLRKKLQIDEFANHFITVDIKVDCMVTDDMFDLLSSTSGVIGLCSCCDLENNTSSISITVDALQSMFYGWSPRTFVENYCRKRSNYIIDVVSRMFHSKIKVKSIWVGDCKYASMNYLLN